MLTETQRLTQGNTGITSSTGAINGPDATHSVDELAWDVYGCWKERPADRFGGGSSAPSTPLSQRQYDGENQFEFCEIWCS